MEYQWGPQAEAESGPYMSGKDAAPDGSIIDRGKIDPLSQVAVLVCAPTPPHAPFFISGNSTPLLGYEPQEIVGNSSFWMDSIHTEDTPQLLSGFFHLFTRGHHVYDYRFLRKDGAYKRLLLELHLHRRRKKEPIAMMGFLREPIVTDGILPGDENNGAAFLGNGNAAQLTIDDRLRIREAGPLMEELCGQAPKDMIGRPALELIPPDYAHLASDIFNRVVQRPSKAVRFWLALLHRDGSLRFVLAECKGRLDTGGRRVILMKCRDISGLIALDAKSRVRCTTRLLSVLSREDGMPRNAKTVEPLDRLTGREREILYLTIEGLSSTELGERLSISSRTVEAHRAHIMTKLGVHSLSQLIRYTVSCIAYPESA